MTQRKQTLSKAEIARAFEGDQGFSFPPILGIEGVSKLLGRAPGTVREWVAKGHFEGCFRKRGKRLSFWRDRVIDRFFNGPEWE